MEELALLREAAQSIGVVGLLMLAIYGLVKGWIYTRAAVDVMKEQSQVASKITGEAIAEEMKADNEKRFKSVEDTILVAVENGVAKGIENVYTFMRGDKEETDGRLKAIEVSIDELRRHKMDNKDRL